MSVSDQHIIRLAIDSLPPNMNGPPPIAIEDILPRFSILYKAAEALKRWKVANENVPPLAELVISPITDKKLSVDDAVRKINDEVPYEYRLVRPYKTFHVPNEPAEKDRAEWLMKNRDTNALLKKWGSQELQVFEDSRREKLLESMVLFTHQQSFYLNLCSQKLILQ
ncbi:hypothetical protein F5146DRAFT_1228810 [Armillaria mellea]|nr:hypothetical protein F5146DRAFT_1228810 [Armillaria mellea]